MTAEVSKAAQRAVEEARAKGLSEEDVQAAAHAAAEEAAASSDVRRAAAGAMDAQSRYYALAHRRGRGARAAWGAGWLAARAAPARLQAVAAGGR